MEDEKGMDEKLLAVPTEKMNSEYSHYNELKDRFLRFLDGYDVDNIILGCTEFPVLLRHIDMGEGTSNFYDPLTYGIQEIHRIIS